MLVVLLAFPVTGVVRDERRRLMCVVCEVAFAPIFIINYSFIYSFFNYDYFKLMLIFGPDAMSSSNQREVIVLVSV